MPPFNSDPPTHPLLRALAGHHRPQTDSRPGGSQENASQAGLYYNDSTEDMLAAFGVQMFISHLNRKRLQHPDSIHLGGEGAGEGEAEDKRLLILDASALLLARVCQDTKEDELFILSMRCLNKRLLGMAGTGVLPRLGRILPRLCAHILKVSFQNE